jgi:outer membrane protein
MTRAITLCAAALLAFRPGDLAAQTLTDSLTLEQVVQLVLASHPAVLQATAGIAAADARVAERRSAYYPALSAGGSAVRTAPVPNLTVPNVGSFSLTPRVAYATGVQLHQTVWDFGRRSAGVALARAQGASASGNVALVQSELAFRAIDAFYAVLFLRQSLAVQDDEIQALEQHLAVSRERARSGAVTDFDVLTTQVRVATARSQRIDVANQLQRREIELRELLGVGAEQPLPLKGAFTLTPVALTGDSLTPLALRQRPEMALARQAEASAAAAQRFAALGQRPLLSVDAQAGFRNGFEPNLDRIEGNWNAGVSVQVPVFDGGRTRDQVAEAEANLTAAEDHTRDVTRRVAADVQQALANLQASRDKLATADLQVEQADTALSLANTRYRAGVITNLEVLDAQTALAQARLLRVRTQYAFVQSRYDLERAVGATPW